MGIELQEVQSLPKKVLSSASSATYSKPNTMTARRLSLQPPTILKREVIKMPSSITVLLYEV